MEDQDQHKNWFESYRERDPSTLSDIATSLAPLSMWAIDHSLESTAPKAEKASKPTKAAPEQGSGTPEL